MSSPRTSASVAVSYGVVLDVAVKHGFYADDVCPSLSAEPTHETAKLLRDHRCLLRHREGGFQVITALDVEGAPMLGLPVGARLRFHLLAEDAALALVTDMSEIDEMILDDQSPLFTNADLSGDRGALALVASPRSSSFAQLEIIVRPSGVGPAAASYWATFGAKKAYWAYYCVTDLPADKVLQVVDGDGQLVFSSQELNEPDPGDPVAVELQRLYGDARRVRFLSASTVLCRQAPRRKLKLQLVQARALDDEDLLDPLPNPSPHSFSRTSPAEPPTPPGQPCLFQIIKFNANPLPNT